MIPAPAPLPPVRLPFPVLERLLAPFELRSFLAEHWESQPLLVRGSCPGRAAFQGISSQELVRAALAHDKASVEILVRGKAKTDVDSAAAERALREGSSLRILQAQRFWDAARTFCAELSLELSHTVGANVYVTPANHQGLDSHVDDHDVFVVQMHGRKAWALFGEPYRLPLGHRPLLAFERPPARRDYRGMPYGSRQFAEAELGPPQLETVLEPGDLLYLPRGVVHRAAAVESESVHVTLGVHAATWADLLLAVVARAAREEPELRRALPAGFARLAGADADLGTRARDLLHEIARKHDARDALEEVVARFFLMARSRQAAAEESPPAISDPSEDDLLRLAPDVLLSRRDDALALRRFSADAEDVFLPAAFERALLEMAERPAFRIRELTVLTPASARALVRHLCARRVVVRAG